MAFLDNSGDLLLDAVLTDEGRRRLALGNGSFNIAKFALADDEIDYSLYDKTPTSGSAYSDLRILQLPVFEAFTNNLSSAKSKLLTYADSSLLYLPVVKLNTKNSNSTASDANGPVGGYYVSVSTSTTDRIRGLDGQATSTGVRYAQPGADGAGSANSTIMVDQGIDNQAFSLAYLVNQDAQLNPLVERSYIVEVDNRLLGISPTIGVGGGARVAARPSFVDDDNIATYVFGMENEPNYFARQNGGLSGLALPAFEYSETQDAGRGIGGSAVSPTNTTGLLGSRLILGLASKLALQQSNDLFTTLGGSTSVSFGPGAGTASTFRFINTSIRITGFNTGYRIEIPLKLLKYPA